MGLFTGFMRQEKSTANVQANRSLEETIRKVNSKGRNHVPAAVGGALTCIGATSTGVTLAVCVAAFTAGFATVGTATAAGVVPGVIATAGFAVAAVQVKKGHRSYSAADKLADIIDKTDPNKKADNLQIAQEIVRKAIEESNANGQNLKFADSKVADMQRKVLQTLNKIEGDITDKHKESLAGVLTERINEGGNEGRLRNALKMRLRNPGTHRSVDVTHGLKAALDGAVGIQADQGRAA